VALVVVEVVVGTSVAPVGDSHNLEAEAGRKDLEELGIQTF
jgi:hypothetical protein